MALGAEMVLLEQSLKLLTASWPDSRASLKQQQLLLLHLLRHGELPAAMYSSAYVNLAYTCRTRQLTAALDKGLQPIVVTIGKASSKGSRSHTATQAMLRSVAKGPDAASHG